MLEGLLLLGALSTTISILIFFPIIFDDNLKKDILYFGCPKYIYNNSKLNWFGTYMAFILFLCIVPVLYMLWLIYWMCHVGRK